MLRIHQGLDGCFWIPRRCKETEEYLDSRYVRLPNQLKWINKLPNEIDFFKNLYENKLGYIVGKGPSLDYLIKEVFKEDCPIIALNESIHKVEQVCTSEHMFVLQMDKALGSTCLPKRAKLFVSPWAADNYKDIEKYVIDPRSLTLDQNAISAVVAVMLLRTFGCKAIQLISFDGCLEQNYEYAKIVGYSSTKGGSPLRFKSHKEPILQVAKNLNVTWVTPGTHLKFKEHLFVNRSSR